MTLPLSDDISLNVHEPKSKHFKTAAKNNNELLIASQYGLVWWVDSYLSSGRDRYVVDENNQNALVIASLNGHENVVKLLLEHGFDARANGGQNALTKASEMGHDTVMKLLLDHGSDINHCNSVALRLASQNGHDKAVELLLDRGSNGINPAFLLASQGGHNKTIELLLKRGSNVNTVDEYGMTALHKASEKGHDETVKLLLDYGSDINRVNNAGFTALMRASRNGHTKTVELLLDRGSDVNAQDEHNFTALIHASNQARDKIVKLLLDRGSNVNATDNNGETALMKASRYGYEAAAKLLLDFGCDIDAVDNSGETALIKASHAGHPEVVAVILQKRSNLNDVDDAGERSLIIAARKCNIKSWDFHAREFLLVDRKNINSRNELGHNALMKAALKGNDRFLLYLSLRTYDLNATDNNGNTALMLASANGHCLSVIKLLYNRNIDVEITNNIGETALMQASKNGHYETVTQLLNHDDSNINAVGNDGKTAFMLASQYGHDKTVELLFERGSDINVVDKNDWSALMLACENGHAEVTQRLLKKGINVTQLSTDGLNSLMIASLNDRTHLIDLLINCGTDINATNNDGNTALMLASEKGFSKTVKRLLDNKCLKNCCNTSRMTALMLATKHGYYKTVELLLKNEADANIVDENGWNALLIASLYGQETVNEIFLRSKHIMFTVQEKEGLSCSGTLDDECLLTDFVKDSKAQILLGSAECLNKWWNLIVEMTNSRLDILRSSSSFNSKIIDAVFYVCKKTNVPVTKHNEPVTEEQVAYECSNTLHAVILIHIFIIHFNELIAELYQKYELSIKQPSAELRLFTNALNVHLQKLRTFVFQTKQIEYNENNFICLLRNLLEGFVKQITQAKEHVTSSVGYKMYEEEIWSSILGLKKVFGEKLHEVSPEGKEHQTESYFLKCFLQNVVDDSEELSRVTYVDAINLAEKLKQIGFLDDTASFIANNIPADLVERQTILFWAFRYIDNIFQHHPMISDCPRFPYNTELTDTWFQCDISTEYRDDDDGDDTVPIHMINVVERQLNFSEDEKLRCPQNKLLLYHGTTHRGACSILKHGIVLSSGSKYQDFSHGDGFYLYFDPLKAKTCGQALTLTHSAIVAFAVDTEFFYPMHTKGLHLTNNKSLWLKVVQTCRSGYVDKKLKHELLNGYAFVIGPECTRPGSLYALDADDGSLLGDFQFCVRDEEYAIKFGTLKNIAFVIFY